MANHKSAIKRIRSNQKRADRNRANLSRVRTFVKKFEGLVAAGKADEAAKMLPQVQSEIARGVTKGVLHRNTASRKISRLTKRVRAA